MRHIFKMISAVLMLAVLAACGQPAAHPSSVAEEPETFGVPVISAEMEGITESPTALAAPAVTPIPEPTAEPVSTPEPTPEPAPTPEPTPEPTPVPERDYQYPLTEAPGIWAEWNDAAVIDYSNCDNGYVMVQYTAYTDTRLKAQVIGPSTTYSYNLTPGQWAAFPLSQGDGNYTVSVYINVYDTKYATVLSANFNVALVSEFSPFLYANQYVDFESAPNSVEKAKEITAGLVNPLEMVAAVYDYVVGSMTYDYHKADTVKSGYLPVLDEVLAAKTGICFDYAALMTGMLRSQGVPCKMVVGYAGSAYHAWINVWTEESGWIDGFIFFDGVRWHRMDPTFASSGDKSESVMSYIGDGTNYTDKYVY